MPSKVRSNERVTMLDDFSKYLEENISDISNKQIFLAISGGIDSMTLSHLLKIKGVSHALLHLTPHLLRLLG